MRIYVHIHHRRGVIVQTDSAELLAYQPSRLLRSGGVADRAESHVARHLAAMAEAYHRAALLIDSRQKLRPSRRGGIGGLHGIHQANSLLRVCHVRGKEDHPGKAVLFQRLCDFGPHLGQLLHLALFVGIALKRRHQHLRDLFLGRHPCEHCLG